MSIGIRLEFGVVLFMTAVVFVSFLLSCPLYGYVHCMIGDCDAISICPANSPAITGSFVPGGGSPKVEETLVEKKLDVLPHEPFKYTGLLHFDRIPIRKRGFTIRQASSFDWSANNQDFNHFISIKGDRLRIFEDYGPGCILRSYVIFTSGSDSARGLQWDILVEVDGQLVFNRTIREMATGVHGPYYFPLAGLNDIRSGFFHYVPIYYKKSCIITVDTKGFKYPKDVDPRTHFKQGLYYIFTYHKYNFLPEDDKLTTFEGDNEDVGTMMTAMFRGVNKPSTPHYNSLPIAKTLKKEDVLIKKGLNKIASYQGKGAIAGFNIRIQDGLPKKYTHMNLVVRFDKMEKPQINVPLSWFFSSETGTYTVQSIAIGFDPELGGYCHFPMPFWSSFEISIENNLSEVATISYEFNITGAVYPEGETGYFHATSHGEAPIKKRTDFPMFRDEGRWGHVVGLTLITRRNVSWPEADPYEGDERFYIDDKSTCSVHGTGTEDYFNTGHLFFRMNEFNLPFHGNPYYWRESHVLYDIHAYRMLIQDFIPYRSYISMGMESSPGALVPSTADYTAIAYHYSGTKPGMKQTDELNVGDKKQEAEHKYSCEQCEPSGDIHDTYDALLEYDPKFTDSGYKIRKSSHFQVKIAPGASGVLIRRRLDHRFQNQKAKVFVDNAEVGIWFEPKKNPFFAFRNSDFWIPQFYTKGKSQLSIRTEVFYQGSDEGENDIWSELHYWVFCEV